MQMPPPPPPQPIIGVVPHQQQQQQQQSPYIMSSPPPQPTNLSGDYHVLVEEDGARPHPPHPRPHPPHPHPPHPHHHRKHRRAKRVFLIILLAYSLISVAQAILLCSFFPLINVGVALIGLCALKPHFRRRPHPPQPPQPHPHPHPHGDHDELSHPHPHPHGSHPHKWRREKKKIALAMFAGILLYKLVLAIVFAISAVLHGGGGRDGHEDGRGGGGGRHHHRGRIALALMIISFLLEQVLLAMSLRALRWLMCKHKKHHPHHPHHPHHHEHASFPQQQQQQQQQIPLIYSGDNSMMMMTEGVSVHAHPMNIPVYVSSPLQVLQQQQQQQQQQVPTAPQQQPDRAQYENHLTLLRQMGFTDEKRNLELLHKHSGNIPGVVRDICDM